MFPSLVLTVRVFSQHAKSFLISKMPLKPLIQREAFIVIYTSLVKQFYASPQANVALRQHRSAHGVSYILVWDRWSCLLAGVLCGRMAFLAKCSLWRAMCAQLQDLNLLKVPFQLRDLLSWTAICLARFSVCSGVAPIVLWKGPLHNSDVWKHL